MTLAALVLVFRSTLILESSKSMMLSMFPLMKYLIDTSLKYFLEIDYHIFFNNNRLFCSARYDPSTGIYGMDFYIVLERPGYRVGRRRRCKSRVGIQHRVTKEDAMKWFQVKYEGVILNKSQNITG